MAVSARFRPVLDGLRPVPGAKRLVGLRLVVVMLAAAPALLTALIGLSSGAARQPYYTEIAGRLPIARLARLMRDLPDGYGAALGASIVLAVLADQILTGGAAALLAPGRPLGDRPRVFAVVCREGLTHLWPFLRAVGLGLLLIGIGAALLRLPFKRLESVGYQKGWSGTTMTLLLPLLSVAVTALWTATVGALVFWCRLITAADGRRFVRRTALLALRVLWRYPLRSWGLFASTTLISTLLSAAVLLAWRQAEPVRGGALALLLGGWAAAMFLQALIWVWLVRAGWLLYASRGLADLREVPDAPWGVIARLRRLVGLGPRPRSRPAPAEEPAPAPLNAEDADQRSDG